LKRHRLVFAAAAVLMVLVALAASGPAGAAGAKPKPTCAVFLKKKSIVDILKEEVVLTKPNPVSAVGAWAGGPRTACFANLPLPFEVIGAQPETVAIWGVGYGLTGSEWNKIKSVEGGMNSEEGSGPWSREAASIGGKYQAFFARTAAFTASDGSPVSYLYVLTPHKNLFYLDIKPATTAQLLGLAKEILREHPKF
jgi:hypothetical protein